MILCSEICFIFAGICSPFKNNIFTAVKKLFALPQKGGKQLYYQGDLSPI